MTATLRSELRAATGVGKQAENLSKKILRKVRAENAHRRTHNNPKKLCVEISLALIKSEMLFSPE
jgi:hypothetical protein